MNNIAILASALLLSAGGCDFTVNNNGTPEPASTNSSASATCAVVVGMENSKFAGSCPGAKYDSDRMYKVIAQYTEDIVLLQDSAATKSAIVNAMKKGVEKSGNGLFILYYSGHGGSDPFPDTGIEETDGRDEYLCPYDIYLRDNEIWNVISKSKGRVFIIADCCHSRTCFRAPRFTLKATPSLRATHTETGAISMQCWSGCPDDTFSYGSTTGGKFTNAFLKYYKSGVTYDTLWSQIEADKELRKFEEVQRTLIGKSFGSTPIFK